MTQPNDPRPGRMPRAIRYSLFPGTPVFFRRARVLLTPDDTITVPDNKGTPFKRFTGRGWKKTGEKKEERKNVTEERYHGWHYRVLRLCKLRAAGFRVTGRRGVQK